MTKTLICGRFQLTLDRPLVMGIVNVTPDSFSDGGIYAKPEAALAQVDRLIAEGADLIDIGGESTRPAARELSVNEEMDRVLPVLEALAGCPVPVSLDTRRTQVMRAGLSIGVDMINDVAALTAVGAMEVLGASRAAVCLMHKQGEPQTMQLAPQYTDVVSEVNSFLLSRAEAAMAAGIARERIVLDPGFGFGKALEHNVSLFRHLSDLAAAGFPLLVGVSRKSMLAGLLEQARSAMQRDAASLAAAILAVQRGASIVRVHAVRDTCDVLKICRELG